MNKSATLRELAALVGGTVRGDAEIRIKRVAPLDVAKEGDLTFFTNPKYAAALLTTQASAVIIASGTEVDCHKPSLECANPYLAFAKILTLLAVTKPENKGVLPGATVATTAVLADGVTIYPGCVIGERVRVGAGSVLYPGVVIYDDVVIGSDCLLHAGVVVREGSRIGDRVILQPNVTIGADGFGFAPEGERYFKIPQVGIVVLEDDVEIGSCSCIDRAALGITRIRRGTKIDNLVQIGHNVDVGEDTIIVSQSGIAGSTTIGRHCTFGGQSAATGHLKIGDNVTVGGRGGVAVDTPGNQIVSGAPAMPHRD
ncbi:MAG: UDP-3-O-(3-hydroxymyristoyl)glucosamine N-acyltransferase, partial [Candidatus Zixiibacteriota bacterium]